MPRALKITEAIVMPNRLTTIDISKEDFKFSGAHFTIFSATQRERLHGHNFKVRAQVIAPVDENGMCFNYQEIKIRLRKLCDALDEYVLLPGLSPHLTIETQQQHLVVTFAQQSMSFLQSDTRVLAIRNTTVEEFSHYILDQLINTDDFFIKNNVKKITVGVSSGDGQWGSSSWQKEA